MFKRDARSWLRAAKPSARLQKGRSAPGWPFAHVNGLAAGFGRGWPPMIAVAAKPKHRKLASAISKWTFFTPWVSFRNLLSRAKMAEQAEESAFLLFVD